MKPNARFIYMVRSASSRGNVVRIGNGGVKSVKRHGADSKVLFNIPVANIDVKEKFLLEVFRNEFTLVRGQKYFAGDTKKMISLFRRIFKIRS